MYLYRLCSSLILAVIFMMARADATVDSLIMVLDAEIDHKDVYAAQKRASIQPLHERWREATDLQLKFALTDSLFNQYKNFSMDSTLVLAMEAARIADELGTDRAKWESALMLAEAYKSLGLYHKSLWTLNELPPEAVDTLGPKVVYRKSSIFYTLVEMAPTPTLTKMYQDSLLALRDSLIRSIDTPEGKIINTFESLKERGQYQAAKNYYLTLSPEDRERISKLAVVDFIVGENYVLAGDTATAMPYLLRSAISDIRSSDRKYNSLPLLAKLMYEQGDLQHAYDYIMCSLIDISDANAQSRMSRINEALPIITTAYATYQKKEAKTRMRLRWVGSAFIIFLIITAFVFFRRNKQLRADRHHLTTKNAELVELKDNADRLNLQEREKSSMKDGYIGDLFRLCSEYINIISRERGTLLKTVRSGKIADVEKAITQLDSPDRLAEFFERFDQCFLALFPDFIEKFNQLLKEEYRYNTRTSQLNPELRIVALVRLGITETSRIAAFLRYSNQTVYNYRFRIKSHAIDSEIDLVEAIQCL